MEYTNNPNRVDPKVKEIQSMLNRALDNAVLLLKADSSLPSLLGDPHYFQTLHHRNYIPNGWGKISEDGRFSNDTEKAVKSFQEFLYITINGIVGDTTYSYLTQLSSINKANIKLIGDGVQPKQNNISVLDGYEKESIGDVFIKVIKPIIENSGDIFTVLIKKNGGTGKVSQNISVIWNNFIREFYARMLNYVSHMNDSYSKACTLMHKHFDSLAKKNNGKHTHKVKKYKKNIDKILESTFKYYTKSKVNEAAISKLIKISQNGLKFIGKAVKYYDVVACLWKLCDDLNNMSDTSEWQTKWNKDFSEALEVLISLVVGALVAVVATIVGCVGAPAIIIGIVVAILISVIHMILRKFAWYNDFEAKIGMQASIIAKSVINDGFKSFDVYDGYYLTVVYPKKY